MNFTLLILMFFIGMFLGAILIWLLIFKPQLRRLGESLTTEQRAKELLLIEQGKVIEKLEISKNLEERFKDTFESLSAKALSNNNESFLSLAKSQLEKFQEGAKHDLELRQKSIDQLVKPIADSLSSVDKKVQELDKTQTETKAAFNTQINNLMIVHTSLQKETQNLVYALRSPSTRGRWGEVQLKNVVEMAGMVEYCDFTEQQSTDSESGRLRPDMQIRLPGGKTVVVDSKVALDAYLDSIETTDEAIRLEKLKQHALQVRTHLKQLSGKSYWAQFDQSPEFVVLFLPGEMFFSAALQQAPELIEFGAREKVIIATPTTLIALLRAVAYGWTQERLSKNAEEISNLGRRLYSRIKTFTGHMTNLSSNLKKSVDYYNKAIGSLETNVLPSVRTLKNLSVSPEADIENFEPIEIVPREIQSPELFSSEKAIDENFA